MLRRSERHQAASYDANGRDYLANELKLTRKDFEAWLQAPSVHNHLLLWYKICVLGRRRYNDAAEWINCGADGYFYHEHGLESDLLLSCLGGDDNEKGTTPFGDQTIQTNTWPTERLWARAASRIVQHNKGPGQVFEKVIILHPAAAYALAIDILCIAFHSMAYRQTDSVWHGLIGGFAPTTAPTTTTEMMLDQAYDTWSEEMASRVEVDAVSLTDSDGTCEVADSDFIAPRTPDRLDDAHLSTPGAPRKLPVCDDQDVRAWVDTLYEGVDEGTGGPVFRKPQGVVVVDGGKAVKHVGATARRALGMAASMIARKDRP